MEDIEKKWLSFQLLCALRDCHARNVYHGDIKTENTLVTSWNWLFLSDFSSSFKPTYLPEDNPADFSYYFDTSGRRTCYLAPERFLKAQHESVGKKGVTWAMDIFSAGCVIAELFLEAPIFSLSQLYKYRRGEYDPVTTHLSKIEDKQIRELVSHMIQVEPESRYSADEYLNFWRRKAFPEYFFSFLHQYMGLITDPTSGQKPLTSENANRGEADDRINRVFLDFDKISYFLGYEEVPPVIDRPISDSACGSSVIPVHLDIPNNRHTVSIAARRSVDDGTLLFLTLVVSSLRSTARTTAKLRACDLLLAFAERITDEAKLDRILPYAMTLLNDPAEIVRIASIRTVTQLMAMVTVVSPVNAYVFPEYILPRLQQFIPGLNSHPPAAVVATYASCLATLADTSSRFLDMMQALRADGSLPSVDFGVEDGGALSLARQNMFDNARTDLLDYFEAHTKALLTDTDPFVRRAFLGSVSRLCVFFGSSRANEVVLSHLNTYLNDKDWMLRCAFFETIVGIATFIGGTSLEEYILPLMIPALADQEEFVIQKVIRSLAGMAELGLFQPAKIWDLVDLVARFTMHPNIWIREAAASFISASTTHLSNADKKTVMLPIIQPYLRTASADFGEVKLLDALHRPLSRAVFDMASSWATRVEKGIFWDASKQSRHSSSGTKSGCLPTIMDGNFVDEALSRVPKNEEDEQWLTRLRNIGMGPKDEWKLVVLRDHVWRVALTRPKEHGAAGDKTALQTNGVLSLRELGLTPQTIFFDEKQDLPESSPLRASAEERLAKPHTIADALLEASMTIDESLERRKKSYANQRKANQLARAKTISAGSREEGSDSHRAMSHSPPSPSRLDSRSTSEDRSKRRRSENAGRMPLPAVSGSDGVQTSSDEHSPTTASGTDSSSPTIRPSSIRHKPSAVSLLSKNDRSKTFAETSTSSETAFGQVEGPFSANPTPPITTPLDLSHDTPTMQLPRFHAAHTYEGHDPSILRLLDSVYLSANPSSNLEFGPPLTPLSRHHRIPRPPITSATESTNLPPWRPTGSLVATFSEHTGPINRVLPSPDHLFFLTCSDDGTVKIWDSARLERNVTHRSRQTHRHTTGAQVKALCFVENTHCFVSGATDGRVQVVRVECFPGGTGATRYGKLRVLKEFQFPKREWAVWMDHYTTLERASVLVIASNTGRIIALDVRGMRLLWTLENPVEHGSPTCLVVDRKRSRMVVGTSAGAMDLWDLRFKVRLRGWGLQGGGCITKLAIHPTRGRGRWVIVSGGTAGEITVWDIEKALCREAYRIGGNINPGPTAAKPYEAWKIDDDTPEALLSRFESALDANTNTKTDPSSTLSNTSDSCPPIQTFAIGLDSPHDARDSRASFLLTAGRDRRVRFWDLNRPEASLIVSGLDPDDPRPTYSAVHPTTNLVLNIERTLPASGTTPDARKEAGTRAPRSTVISQQQRSLLKTHLDAIVDVALLEYPYGMCVSVDRMGVVYVFR